MKLIDKDAVVSWVTEKREAALYRQHNLEKIGQETYVNQMIADNFGRMLSFLDTLEVKDLYEQCIQYPSIKDAIQAQAETYSFNIESELFQQLTKEQQKLWRKEIEEAYVNAGNAGYLLAKDTRYKENLEVK